MQVCTIASARAVIGGADRTTRTARSSAVFHCSTTLSAASAVDEMPSVTRARAAKRTDGERMGYLRDGRLLMRRSLERRALSDVGWDVARSVSETIGAPQEDVTAAQERRQLIFQGLACQCRTVAVQE